jgi:hypothetical protein
MEKFGDVATTGGSTKLGTTKKNDVYDSLCNCRLILTYTMEQGPS